MVGGTLVEGPGSSSQHSLASSHLLFLDEKGRDHEIH